ncbi:hypothetical protein NP493_60g00010 [Ridgeia piscesae]|uniref:Uncharacterized protein n=1 Tax=Ridgeia piscesae TaxID=27915 RepID=A0AAD9PA99_RIDPI|nr:hypothetical protein NP493_60g00010 [Ridgeia piscesae]
MKDILEIIEYTKFLNEAVDRTFNIHTDEWNLAVINKSLRLLHSKTISYPELHAVRVAFQTYESGVSNGMLIDERTLQRSLKLSGRMISPLKMMHRIKHMKQHFDDPERIQLHEYLDLLLWCDKYEEGDFRVEHMDQSKDDLRLFKLVDFDTLLSHYDERLTRSLDRKYLEQEWGFSKVQHGSAQMPRDILPVDPAYRQRQVRRHGSRYHRLKTELDLSQRDLSVARAGFLRDAGQGARGQGLAAELQSPRQDTPVSRPLSVQEMHESLSRRTRSAAGSRADVSGRHSAGVLPLRPPLTECDRPQTAPAVTQDDIRATAYTIEGLKFEMATLEMKYKQHLAEDLDYMLPGYRDRAEKKTPGPRQPEAPKTHQKRKPRLTTSAIDRLCHPPNPGPSPCHAKMCDARFRSCRRMRRRAARFVTVPVITKSAAPEGKGSTTSQQSFPLQTTKYPRVCSTSTTTTTRQG